MEREDFAAANTHLSLSFRGVMSTSVEPRTDAFSETYLCRRHPPRAVRRKKKTLAAHNAWRFEFRAAVGKCWLSHEMRNRPFADGTKNEHISLWNAAMRWKRVLGVHLKFMCAPGCELNMWFHTFGAWINLWFYWACSECACTLHDFVEDFGGLMAKIVYSLVLTWIQTHFFFFSLASHCNRWC